MASSEVFAEMSGLTDTSQKPQISSVADAVKDTAPASPSPSASSSLSDSQRELLEPDEDDHLNGEEIDAESEGILEKELEEGEISETEEAEAETDCISYHTFYAKGREDQGISFRVRKAGGKKFVTIRHEPSEELPAEFIQEKLGYCLGVEDQTELLESKRQSEFDTLVITACAMGAGFMCLFLYFISMVLAGNEKIRTCGS